MTTTPLWFKRTIIAPVNEFERDAVRHVQMVLRCPITGQMDEATVSHIRGLQRFFGLQVSGVIDAETAEQVERLVPHSALHVR